MSSLFEYESLWPLTPEEMIGKALIEAIKASMKEFKEEFGIKPDLLLIHPGTMRHVYMYSYRVESRVYSHVDNIPMMPNDPSMFVLHDYLREPGTFLVTTRKLLERSGIKGDSNV